MKVALCFLINYTNQMSKENIWKEWIFYNRDIINVYFHYNKNVKIRSPWIKKNCIKDVKETSYFYVVPALFSILKYAYYHDKSNTWFCLITDSCVPIISPAKFRELFFEHYDKSFLKWSPPNWNIMFHKRANLFKIPDKYHLSNEPWFILNRQDVYLSFLFVNKEPGIFNTVIQGIIANESIFAIILSYFQKLPHTMNETTTISDWTKMSSTTSPYVFTGKNLEEEKKTIQRYLLKNKYAMFLRKIHPKFPSNEIEKIIYKEVERSPLHIEEITKILLSTPDNYLWMFILGVILLFNISIFCRNLDIKQMWSLVRPPIWFEFGNK